MSGAKSRGLLPIIEVAFPFRMTASDLLPFLSHFFFCCSTSYHRVRHLTPHLILRNTLRPSRRDRQRENGLLLRAGGCPLCSCFDAVIAKKTTEQSSIQVMEQLLRPFLLARHRSLHGNPANGARLRAERCVLFACSCSCSSWEQY